MAGRDGFGLASRTKKLEYDRGRYRCGGDLLNTLNLLVPWASRWHGPILKKALLMAVSLLD